MIRGQLSKRRAPSTNVAIAAKVTRCCTVLLSTNKLLQFFLEEYQSQMEKKNTEVTKKRKHSKPRKTNIFLANKALKTKFMD